MSTDELSLVAPLVASGILPQPAADECLRTWQALAKQGRPVSLLAVLVKRGLLTRTQALVLAGVPLEGRQPFPNYRLIRRVDEGGMASVYEATYLPLQMRVALKVLRTEFGLREAYRLRFRREAGILLALRHPNIVEGRECAAHDGVEFYAMSFVDGVSVLSLLDRGIPVGEGLALHIACQTASALQHMYEKGIVHRDIKPANLILDQDGTVHIIDFGLAKVMGGMWQDTTEETTVGTLEYMSPEQARGSPDVDIRSDIYSLGVSLYHMITGELPFKGTAEEIMYGHVKRQVELTPEHLRRLSPQAQFVLRKTMAKDPAHRYATPQEMLDDLRALAGDIIDSRGPVPDAVGRAAIEAAPMPAAPAAPAAPHLGPAPQPRRSRPHSSGAHPRHGRRRPHRR